MQMRKLKSILRRIYKLNYPDKFAAETIETW